MSAAAVLPPRATMPLMSPRRDRKPYVPRLTLLPAPLAAPVMLWAHSALQNTYEAASLAEAISDLCGSC
ncbi:jg2211 [Pararge aegeria aegeria]|uniref:Jg2211 protein n=1 Tax=Pararge aegeria aegeria TaxID=348720 RepID=A0A8S4QT01_9NEOP|nr:jg2211 [Pararge aegeria aegeria]